MKTSERESEFMDISASFSVRPATFEDVASAANLFNRCSLEQLGHTEFKVEDLDHEWQSPGFDLAQDTRLVFAPDGTLVGYVEFWATAPYVRLYCWGRVDPQYRGQGIGSSLLRWVENTARQRISRAPEGTQVVLTQGSLSTDLLAQELFEIQGFSLARYFSRMVIELDGPVPDPVLPEGIVIRPFVRGVEERALIRAISAAFKDHWGYVQRPEEEDFRQWMHHIDHDPEFDPSLWFVAMTGSEIAGMSLCHSYLPEDPEMGWVGTLGVLRPWRHQGLGLALLHHSFREFQRRGRQRVGLGVDAQSLTGATRLYERAGMKVVRQYVNFEKELRSGKSLATLDLGA